MAFVLKLTEDETQLLRAQAEREHRSMHRGGAPRRPRTRLTDLAGSGDVTVVGHGFLNILVARGLRRRGWVGPRIPGARHGATTTYRRSIV